MEIEGNLVRLTGRVNYLDIKYFDSGLCKVRILLGKAKNKKGDYQSFGVNFFDEVAEQVGNSIQKGDYIAIEGTLREDRYTKNGREISSVEVYGKEFAKVVYDENKKKYVEAGTIQATPPDDEEIPW